MTDENTVATGIPMGEAVLYRVTVTDVSSIAYTDDNQAFSKLKYNTRTFIVERINQAQFQAMPGTWIDMLKKGMIVETIVNYPKPLVLQRPIDDDEFPESCLTVVHSIVPFVPKRNRDEE